MASKTIIPSTLFLQEPRHKPDRSVSFDENTTPSLKSSMKETEKKFKRNVSFDQISIRSYERSLADHPAVSSGPGLSISWKYEEGSSQSVDEFELSRSGSRKINYVDLVVPREERERILREECGYARSDLAQCVRSVNAMKHNRRQTINNLSLEHCEEGWQRVLRKVKRCFGRRRSSAKEIKTLWKDAEKSQSGCSDIDSCGSSIRSRRSSLKGSRTIDYETHCPPFKREPSIPGVALLNDSSSSVFSDITTVTTQSMSHTSDPKSRSRPKTSKLRLIIAEEEGDW